MLSNLDAVLNETWLSLSHSLKHFSLISTMESGMLISVKPLPQNAPAPMRSNLEYLLNSTWLRLQQNEKHLLPITFTESGMLIPVKPLPQNACDPI